MPLTPTIATRFESVIVAALRSFVVILFSTLPAKAAWFEEEQAIMGTKVRIELWHAEEKTARQAIDDAMQEMRRIEQIMSPHIPSSDIALANAYAATRPVPITEEVSTLIETAIQFSQKSGGAFDITFASIGRLYDFRQRVKPADLIIEKLLSRVDYRHLLLNQSAGSLVYKKQGVSIDLGGIAKGYAVDRAIAVLSRYHIASAYVSAGGDSRIIGDKRGRPWMIGIKHPRSPEKMVAILPLENTAFSTSGDYERFFVTDGVRYHHILDPKTGKASNASQSVTIIGPRTVHTDALSTTVFVLGPQRGLALVNDMPDIEAVIVDPNGRLLYSQGFEEAKQ